MDIGAVDNTPWYGRLDISSVLVVYCLFLYCANEYVADVKCGLAVAFATHQFWLTGHTWTTI